MSQSKIKIQLTKTDWVFEIISVIAVLFSVGFALLFYKDLPDTIVVHFNALGKADGFGNKSILFVLPIIAIVVYISFTFTSKVSQIFNYPFKITEENAARQFQNAVLTIRILKTVVAVIFSYLTFATVQNGLGKMQGLDSWFLPITLFIVLTVTGFSIYRAYKLK